MPLSDAELGELAMAKLALESPSLAAKLSQVLGAPIERGLERLPARWSERVHELARRALTQALEVALSTLENAPGRPASARLHLFAGAAAGAFGGAFGLAALTVELPISTAILLRSIADVARAEGEDLAQPETQLACLQVFALGGTTSSDDAAETGYFAVRAGLAKAVSDAARHAALYGLRGEGAPALVRLVARVAERFGLVVSQKAAAQAVPLLGAGAGAVVNTLFLDHFQSAARGHFVVRRLERAHGPEAVRAAWDELP